MEPDGNLLCDPSWPILAKMAWIASTCPAEPFVCPWAAEAILNHAVEAIEIEDFEARVSDLARAGPKLGGHKMRRGLERRVRALEAAKADKAEIRKSPFPHWLLEAWQESGLQFGGFDDHVGPVGMVARRKSTHQR
jgi:hypothetical protein